MVKKSLIWTYRAALSLLWLTIIVLTLSILTLRYFVLPNIADYKDRIEQQISLTAGQKITIGGIEASWNGMNPHLSLRQVAIYDDKDRLALTLHEIETSFSWLSIPSFEPKLASLLIQGPAVSIRRETDGSLIIAGIKMGGTSKPELANWVLRQSRIDIIDATILWQDDLRQAPALMLNDLQFSLESPVWERLLDRHRFALTATPSAGSSHPIDLRGNFYGSDVSKLKIWSGTIYGRLDGTDISAWRQWVDLPFDLSEGYGAARFWLDFANGKALKLTADVILQKVRARLSKTSAEAKLDSLAGRLIWSSHADGQSLNLEGLKLATADGIMLENGTLGVRERHVAGAESIIEGNVLLDEVNLSSVNAITAYLPLPHKTTQQLAEMSPVGNVKKLDVRWKGTRENPNEYDVRMQFTGLGIKAYKDIPGFSGLTGTLNANEKQGTINISSQQVTLDLKNVMRWLIPAEKLTGVVKWANHAQGTDIRVTNLAISSPHLSGAVNAVYKHSDKVPSSMEINGRFDRADAKYALFYYPIILGEDTLSWLDTSIISGQLSDVHVIARGRVDQFPYVNPDHGLFKVTAKLKDAVLDYGEGWPKIEKLNLDMLFQGARMELNANSGNILGNQIKQAKAVIAVLDADNPVLELTGETEGLVADGIRFVNNSPVLELVEGFTKDLRTTGNGKLTLALKMPLEDIDATKIKGSYQMTNASMAGPSIPDISAINATLEFTESAMSAKNIAASIYGGPARIDISTAKDGLVKVAARGNVTDTGLNQAFGNGIGSLISGNTDWFADINIQPKQLDVTLRSSLVGMAINLPAPVGKLAEEKMPLRIEKRQQSATQDMINISMANQISAKILRNELNGAFEIDRGEIGINVLPEIPSQTGIELRGSFAELNMDQWLDVLARIKKAAPTKTVEALPVQRINMSVESLDIFERRINGLKLIATQANDGWKMQIQSKEMSGNAEWLNEENGKLIARLSHLIAPSKTPLVRPVTQAIKEDNKILEYPDLDIVADQFVMAQKDLGKLELKASEKNDDWRINELRISNPDSVLTANGEWHNWRRNPNTQMNVNWEISQLGNTLARFGHPNVIKGGTSKLSGKLRWPGSPHEFDVEQLSGNFTLDARNGQILQIQPGVGRLFSVLTLQNLPRRLTFDFRDVLSSGFTFDKMSSTVNISRGVMRSDNFLLEGPTARVEINGETDLKKETQHLYVKVTPFVSDSVSLAALIGGPAVAAAAYVAQKILKDPLNKFATEEYEIIGTWDKPIELKSDDQNKESSRTIPGQ